MSIGARTTCPAPDAPVRAAPRPTQSPARPSSGDPLPLRIGNPGDAAEREADQAAERAMRGERVHVAPALEPRPEERGERDDEEREADAEIRRKPRGAAPPDGRAPPAVAAALRAPGRPLDPDSRSYFEPRFGISFADVRIHDDSVADRAARAINGRAFTLGRRIAFAAGAYAPATPAGRQLLAHELAHVAQHVAAGARPATIRRQTPAGAAAPAPAPRLDYVFIMGPATDDFYREAELFYRGRLPTAAFISETSLTGILDHLSKLTAPAANIYIVTHGHEDGTLSFALAPGDVDAKGNPDTQIEVIELRARLHPAGGGPSGLAAVGQAVDANTRIHIKGCDIGRTREMVELLDETFGGAGTVTAPSHEQDYGHDYSRGKEPRARERTRLMDAFTAAQPAIPPAPAKIDPSLKGQALIDAKAEHARLTRERKTALDRRAAAIKAEEVRIKPDLDRVAAEASVFETLSGPMFQRRGTTLYTAKELQPEVDRLYGHLPEPARISLAARLVAPDRRSDAAVANDGVLHQKGQRVFRLGMSSETFSEPASVAEAQSQFGKLFASENFRPAKVSSTRANGTITTVIEGNIVVKGQPPQPDTRTFSSPFTPDAELIASGRAEVNNPDRYAWKVVEKHGADGMTTRTAVGERVVAYLHHETLNPPGVPDFNPPENNPDFYATSTFAPPPPAPSPSPGAPAAPAPSPATP